ncbi:MAG: MFS transporter [Chloroflexota bacterium]
MSSRSDHASQNPIAPHSPRSGHIIFILALASMVGMLNVGSFGAFMTAISRDLDVSIPLLGQIQTLIFLGAAGVSLLAGPLADKHGKRRIIIIGLSAIVISSIGTMLAPSYGWLLATRLISVVSAGMLAGTTLATAGSLFDGADRRRAMSWIASGIAAGPIIGIPMLTLVASLSSWRVSYGVLAALALVWIFLLRRVIPDDGTRSEHRIKVEEIVAAYRPLLADKSMLRLYGATLTRAICWIGILTYVGAYLGDELGISTREIGWSFMVGGSGYFIGTKLAGTRLGEVNLRVLVGLSSIAMGTFISLAVTMPVGAAGAVGFLTIGAIAGGLGFVGLITLVSAESPAGQGTTMSLNSAMFMLGSSFGGLLGGLLIAVGGYGALGVGLLGFSIVSTSLVWQPWLALRRALPSRAVIE